MAILTDFSGKSLCPGPRHLEHVSEPIYLTLSAAGIYAGKSLTTMGNVGYQSTCGIFLCRREEVLSGPRVLLILKALFHGFT